MVAIRRARLSSASEGPTSPRHLATRSRSHTAGSVVIEEEGLEIDLATTPWSFRGSLLSCSTKSGNGSLTPGNDVCLITQCREYTMPIVAIRLFPDALKPEPPSGFPTTSSPATIHATTSSIKWLHCGRIIAEAVFESAICIRLRGSALTALYSDGTVDGSSHAFLRPDVDPPNTVEYGALRLKNHRFVATKGKIKLLESRVDGTTHRSIQIESDSGDSDWELRIEEVEEKSHVAKEDVIASEDFDLVASRSSRNLGDFTHRICPWSSNSTLNKTDLAAAYIIWLSIVRAQGLWTRETILMSKFRLNKVWSWDNCFNALAVAPVNRDLALDQILGLYDLQAHDGRLPDCVGWGGIEWTYVKPAIQGWTLQKLLDQGIKIERKQLSVLYEKTAKFTNFWLEDRRSSPKISSIPYYTHGNDCGWDNSTAFGNNGDFLLVGPDAAAYLILQTATLSRLAKSLSLEPEHITKWQNLHESLKKSLVAELWDEETGQFHVKDPLTGDTRPTTSLLRLMPLAAAKYLPSHILSKLVASIPQYLTEWGLATEELASPLYEDDGYWRGPIWAPTTMLIESGLREAGQTALADEISLRFRRLCERSGFAENFDARTGEGYRDRSHTWTASVYLVLRREAAERQESCA